MESGAPPTTGRLHGKKAQWIESLTAKSHFMDMSDVAPIGENWHERIATKAIYHSCSVPSQAGRHGKKRELNARRLYEATLRCEPTTP